MLQKSYMWEGNSLCDICNKCSTLPSKWDEGALQAKQFSQNLFILHHPTNLHEQRQHCTAHKRGNYNKIPSSPIHKFRSIRKSDSSSPEGANNFPYPRFLLFCKTDSSLCQLLRSSIFWFQICHAMWCRSVSVDTQKTYISFYSNL